MSPDVAIHRGICVGLAIGTGIAESISFGLRGSSVEGGAPGLVMVALS